MKTLFLFIPHYVFSSDLLNTDYIKELSSQNKVIVFSPIFFGKDPKDYYQSDNIIYIPWEEERKKFWLFFTKILRSSLIREFDNLHYYKLRKLTKANLDWRRKILRHVGWFIPRVFLTTSFFTKLETGLLSNSKRFQEYILKYQPELILTCTPGFSYLEAEVIIMAKKNNLKTIAINSSWDNFTSNAIQLRRADYLICWNEIIRQEAITIHHYPPEKVFVSGIYRFDHHFKINDKQPTREAFLINKNLNPNKKTLLLSTVPPNTYPPQYNVWRKIIEMQQNNEFNEEVNILIRLHPNDSIEKYREFMGLKNVHIELPGKSVKKASSGGHKIEMDKDDLDNLKYSLMHTDININFRSSLSLEATIYDKPIINLALDGYGNRYQVDWYIPIINSGGVKLVKTTEELKQAIDDYLYNPALDASGRKNIFEKYVSFSDGLSYQRSVEIVNLILKKDFSKNSEIAEIHS